MGYYNVVKPCVVGKLHYARPTTQPIEVADEAAASLVDNGSLEPYGTVSEHPEGWPEGAEASSTGPYAEAGQEAGAEFAEGIAASATKPRRTRRRTED